jgi:hypothetical protein
VKDAYWFDDMLAFCDFVRLCGSGGSGELTLHVLEAAAEPAASALLLLGLRTALPHGAAARRVRVRELPSGELALAGLPHPHGLPVRTTRHGRSLLALADLVPWQLEPETVEQVVVWLRQPEDAGWLIAGCLRLGNDRLWTLELASSSGGSALLLRIEQPPYFLVQRLLEEHAGATEVFHAEADAIFTLWGYRHPLCGLLASAERPADELLFFRPGLGREHVPATGWRDVYDAAGFRLERGGEECRLVAPAVARRFEVPVGLAPRRAPAEPELWMLEGAETEKLESLWAVLDEEQIENLLISVQAKPAGERIVFVREKTARQDAAVLEVTGSAFARVQGLHGLYLPVGHELQPALRRDVYARLFLLRPGELVVVCPARAEGTWRRLRLREASFEPLRNWIDYVVLEHEETLSQLLRSSIFDLGVHGRSPTERPAWEETAGAGRPAAAPEAHETEAQGEQPAGQAEAGPGPADRARSKRARSTPASGQARREAELERALLGGAAPAVAWAELLELKRSRGAWSAVAECCIEGLWAARDPSLEAALLESWLEAALQLEGGGLVAELLEGPAAFAAGEARWSAEAERWLRSVETELRIKERWLLWEQVLRVTGDERKLVELREAIREQLVHAGLGLGEIPAFLRERLLLERRVFATETTAAVEAEDTLAARALLDVLERGFRELPVPELQAIGLAASARARARSLGEPETRLALLGSLDKPGISATARAWTRLLLAADGDEESRVMADLDALVARSPLDRDLAFEHKALAEAAASLREREQTSDPGAFLSAANRQRFYPSGGPYERSELYQMATRLTEAAREDDLARLAEDLPDALDAAAAAHEEQLRDLARLLGALAPALRRFRMHEGFGAAAGRLLAYAPEIEARDSGQEAFYAALKTAHLAACVLEAGDTGRAIRLLEALFAAMGRDAVWLDVIDSASAALRAVEGLALGQRGRPLGALMKALRRRADGLVAGSAERVQLFRLLDQAVEAAVNKEKLVLDLFADYLHRDEHRILERIGEAALRGGR